MVFCVVWAFLWIKNWIAGKCGNKGWLSGRHSEEQQAEMGFESAKGREMSMA